MHRAWWEVFSDAVYGKGANTRDVAIYTLVLSSVVFYVCHRRGISQLSSERFWEKTLLSGLFTQETALCFFYSFFVFSPAIAAVFYFELVPSRFMLVFTLCSSSNTFRKSATSF